MNEEALRQKLERLNELDGHLVAQTEEIGNLQKEVRKEQMWRRMIIPVIIFLFLAFGALAIQVSSNFRLIDEIRDCTTAGPRTPTKDNPRTGHECYDRGQEQTGRAVGQIVDADGDGTPDSVEIETLLKEIGQKLDSL